MENAIEKCNNHYKTEFHKSNATRADNLIVVRSKNNKNIDQKLNSAHATQIKQNIKKLLPIIKTVILCERQEIPICSTEGPLIIDNSEPINNDDNFRALLLIRVSSGDPDLKYDIESQALNATYISLIIETDFLNICGKIVQNQSVYNINQVT